MCMGMFPGVLITGVDCTGLPHVYGDVSISVTCPKNCLVFTPCVWGCFDLLAPAPSYRVVYPMCMGMFRAKNLK